MLVQKLEHETKNWWFSHIYACAWQDQDSAAASLCDPHRQHDQHAVKDMRSVLQQPGIWKERQAAT